MCGFWSSSENSGNNARNWNVNSDGNVNCNWNNKNINNDVRPVLAFLRYLLRQNEWAESKASVERCV